MKMIFNTYEEFMKLIDGNACPSNMGFVEFEGEKCNMDTDSCYKCWMNCGIDIEIKENIKRKVSMEFELPMCPYWNPITKESRHTCGGCHCEEEGNTTANAEYGVMADGDRYCCLGDDINIRASVVDVVKED